MAAKNDTEIATLKANYSNMAEDIKEIRETLPEIFKELRSMKEFFINGMSEHKREADMKYATKEEHNTNSVRIDDVEKSQKNTLITVVSVLGAFVISLLGVIWTNIDKLVK